MAKPCAKARHDEPRASCPGAGHASRVNSPRRPAASQRRAAAIAAFRFDLPSSCLTECRAARRLILAKSGEMRFQFLRQIGRFPGKTAVSVGRAAEMAVRGGARVNRSVKLKMFPDAARGKAHDFEEGRLELFFRDLAGPV